MHHRDPEPAPPILAAKPVSSKGWSPAGVTGKQTAGPGGPVSLAGRPGVPGGPGVPCPHLSSQLGTKRPGFSLGEFLVIRQEE